MSNCERQRLFRERHPGYYQRLHARRRAAINAMAEARLAAEPQAKLAMYAIPTPTVRLALPAPAETIQIPGINAIPTREQFERMRRQLVPIQITRSSTDDAKISKTAKTAEKSH